MLKENTHQIIRESLGQLSQPVKLVLFTSDTNCDSCPDAIAVARAIKAASAKVGLEMYDITMDRDKSGEYGVKRVPSFVVEGQDGKKVTFSGSPEGITLIMLLDALACIGTCNAPGKCTSTPRCRKTFCRRLKANENPAGHLRIPLARVR